MKPNTITALFAILVWGTINCTMAQAKDEKVEAAKPDENPTTFFFELLKSDKKVEESHVVSYNDVGKDIAFGRLKRLKGRFEQSTDQEVHAWTVKGDFALAVISFDKSLHPVNTTQLMLFRQADGWKFIHERNFADAVEKKVFTEKQIEDIKFLFEWGEKNNL